MQHITQEDMLASIEGIKQNYIEDFYWELSEEEVLAMFTDMQLVSYASQKPNGVLVACLVAGILAGLALRNIQYKKYDGNTR